MSTLLESPVAAARFALRGVNDERDICECCGRSNLKRVVWLEPLDVDGNGDGELVAYGVDCAARALGRRSAGAGRRLWDQVTMEAAHAARCRESRVKSCGATLPRVEAAAAAWSSGAEKTEEHYEALRLARTWNVNQRLGLEVVGSREIVVGLLEAYAVWLRGEIAR